MKKMTFFPVVLMVATALTACGAKKQVAQNGYYQQQQQQSYQQPQQPTNQPQQQPAEVRPTRTKREIEPCVAKALEPAENLRMYATAVSYVEQQSISQALQTAREELAATMRASVEGTLKNWAESANIDQRVTTQMLNNRNWTQYIAEEVYRSKTLETTMYDLSDGTVQVYVCIEMGTKQDALVKNIYKKLEPEVSDDEILKMKFNQKQFEEDTKAGLEEYKARRRQAEGL